jgi:hypothetical protein
LTSARIRLLASIGGFPHGHEEVRWRRGRLWYRPSEYVENHVSVVPTVQDWEAFWSAIDRIGVWQWQPRYDDPDILDGTQWTLELMNGPRRVKSFGSNSYPGGTDRGHAQPFEQLLDAIGALVRQPFGKHR